jgi:urease accessory protein UreH
MKWNKRLQCIKFHLYELLEEAKLYLMNNGKGLVGGDKLVAKRCGGKF